MSNMDVESGRRQTIAWLRQFADQIERREIAEVTVSVRHDADRIIVGHRQARLPIETSVTLTFIHPDTSRLRAETLRRVFDGIDSEEMLMTAMIERE